MNSQLDFFGPTRDAPEQAAALPAGFHYQAELITPGEEKRLLPQIAALPFREFEFHGYTGKRRVVSFGWRYDFSGRQLCKAGDIPHYLLALRPQAAVFAGLEPESLEQVLVTEYRPGAGIGWHRDKAVFGQTVGISLLAPCVFRLRRAVGEKWERAKFITAPRSAYLLSGPARSVWEHSIPSMEELRYSVTFRTLAPQ